MEIRRLKRLVCCFRSAIERAKRDGRIPHLRHFPENWCDNASTLLFLFLFEYHGLQGFEWVTASGVGRDSAKHVWLELSGVVLDITGDQFRGEPVESVTVMQNSEWHKAQDVTERWSPSQTGNSELGFFNRIRSQEPWDEWLTLIMKYYADVADPNTA